MYLNENIVTQSLASPSCPETSDLPEVKPLDVCYHEYLSGILDKREFESRIIKFILENPHYYGLYNLKGTESLTDFTCWMYPRLSRSIDKFRETVACFDTYINSVVRYAYREYRIENASYYENVGAYCESNATEMLAAEVENIYNADVPAFLQFVEKKPTACENVRGKRPLNPGGAWQIVSKGEKTDVKSPKQALILLLKSYYFMTDELVERVAPQLGLHQNEIHRMIEKLRAMRHGQEQRIRSFKEHCHSQYFRCVAIERRLRVVDKDSNYYEKLKLRMKLHRARLVNMRRRLQRMRLDASNREVAEVLGIAKGTVDSYIYKAKHNVTSDENVKEL
jgi:hypothetical protein